VNKGMSAHPQCVQPDETDLRPPELGGQDMKVRDLRQAGIAFNAGHAQKSHRMAIKPLVWPGWPNGGPRCSKARQQLPGIGIGKGRLTGW